MLHCYTRLIILSQNCEFSIGTEISIGWGFPSKRKINYHRFEYKRLFEIEVFLYCLDETLESTPMSAMAYKKEIVHPF